MIERITFHGWNALRLRTEKVELVIPTDVGPRVVHCGFIHNGANLFGVKEAQLGGTGEADWCIRGGHRLWIAPEHEVRTYQPDNGAIEVDFHEADRSITLTQPVEIATGIAKKISIEAIDAVTFRVTHTARNEGAWPVLFSAWALTVMRHGGYAVIPLPPKGSHPEDLLPELNLVPWPYTDLSLPCWQFHRDFIGVDSGCASEPQKLGIGQGMDWMAYWQPEGTFVKRFIAEPDAPYPDNDSMLELFVCDWMLELETLSPLEVVEPGEELTHVEYWGLFDGISKPDTNAAYMNELAPVVQKWIHETAL